MKTCLLVLIFGSLLAAQAPSAISSGPATATLDGDVVDQEGRAVAGASIELRCAMTSLSATSDAGGHFHFSEVNAGQCMLTAARAGFLRLSPRLIKVKSGENVTGIRVTLTRQGVISGKVTDDGGWPAASARVQVVRYETWEGTRQLRTVSSVLETDDLGRYRVAHLPAGQYYVQALPGNRLSNWDQRNAPTYYPAALDVSEARLATVEAGKETAGIDIKLMRVEGVEVSGRVVAPPGTAVTQGMPVSMAQDDPIMLWSSRFASPARDGSFTLRHVRPGTYTLKAGLDNSIYSAGAEPGLGAQQTLVVADRDIAGVELTLRPLAFDVAGKVTFEGKGEPSSFTVLLSGMNARQFSAKANADGTFVIKGVVPGRYQVLPRLTRTYVRSVRFGSKDISNYLYLDGSSAGPLDITMRSGWAKVEGAVSDATGGPVQQAFVVFLGKNLPARHSRSVVLVDQFGGFSAGYLLPGEYMVTAVADSDLTAIVDDPVFQKANANSIKTVTLVEGKNPPLALVVAAQ